VADSLFSRDRKPRWAAIIWCVDKMECCEHVKGVEIACSQSDGSIIACLLTCLLRAVAYQQQFDMYQ
jgi:hypothetical protein